MGETDALAATSGSAKVSSLSLEQIEAVIKATCPHCAVGNQVILRQETGEYVHDLSQGHRRGQAFCLAHHFRKSELAKYEN